MDKVLLLSVVVMTVVIPLHAARMRDDKKGLRRALTRFFAYNLVYWVAVIFIWFTLMHGSDPRQLLKFETDSQQQDSQ